VRQIEVRAFEKVQKAVKRHVAALESRSRYDPVERGAALGGPRWPLNLSAPA
jgi:hypothetical protein